MPSFVMRETFVVCHSLDLPSPTEARASRREEGIQDLRKRLWIPAGVYPVLFRLMRIRLWRRHGAGMTDLKNSQNRYFLYKPLTINK